MYTPIVRGCIALFTLSCALPVAAQTPNSSFERVFHSYRSVEKVTVGEFVAEATRLGLVLTNDDRVGAKATFRTLKAKQAAKPRALFERGQDADGVLAMVNGTATREREFNDFFGYADELSPDHQVVGNNGATGDVDTFRYTVAADGYLSASVTPSGTTPISDPTLRVENARRTTVAFNDDSGGTLFSRLTVFVPAGTYFLSVASFGGINGGDYVLDVSCVPFAPPVAALNSVHTGTVPNSSGVSDVFAIVQPSDGPLDISFAGTNAVTGLDLSLNLLLPSGALHFAVDDSSLGLDPRIATDLPAGTYFLEVIDNTGGTGRYTCTVSSAGGGLPPVPCGTTTIGNIDGNETLRLFELSPSALGNHALATDMGPTGSVDTIMDIYDQDLVLIETDDDGGPGLFSQFFLGLAGNATYYVGVRNFPAGGSGDFTLTASACGGGQPPTTADYGTTAGSSGGGDGSAYFFLNVRTPIPVQLAANGAPGFDPVLIAYDPAGRVLLVDDDGGPGLDSFGSTVMNPGLHLLVVKDFGGDAGNFELVVSPPLTLQTFLGVTLPAAMGKEGDLSLLFAAAQEAAAPLPLPGLSGFLLLQPPFFVLGMLKFPAQSGGVAAFGTLPPGFTGVLQSADLTGAPFPLTARNVVR